MTGKDWLLIGASVVVGGAAVVVLAAVAYQIAADRIGQPGFDRERSGPAVVRTMDDDGGEAWDGVRGHVPHWQYP